MNSDEIDAGEVAVQLRQIRPENLLLGDLVHSIVYCELFLAKAEIYRKFYKKSVPDVEVLIDPIKNMLNRCYGELDRRETQYRH